MKADHGRPLLSAADRVLITVTYVRQVCSQRVLSERLGVNPSSIGHSIAETRRLLHEQQITVGQTTLRFRSGQDLRDWLDHGPAPAPAQVSEVLTHPALTGMTRTDFQALLAQIAVAYAAAVEERRHLRRGGDRLPGTRGGVFRQKITDADRILAAVLSQRRLCNQETLAGLFGVRRGTIRNAIDDVLPLLHEHGFTVPRAGHRYTTAADLLASSAPGRDPPR